MVKSLEEISWWHQVPLKDGRITPGRSPVYLLENDYLFDQIDFQDRSVLDIGCWDGYFSFRAEQKGAKEVIGLDDPTFRWGGLDGFQFLSEHFNSKVQWMRGTLFDPPKREFDIVLCYGVLYHLNDPLTAATNCFQLSREIVCFEGLVIENDAPLLMLIPPGDLYGDMSNIYYPTSGYLKMVASLNGFELINYRQKSLDRGALLFKHKEKTPLPYTRSAFSFPPLNLCM